MTTRRERYAWHLMRKTGKYSEDDMLKIVNGRTGKELNKIIDCLKEGKELQIGTASRKQEDYINYLMRRLGYDTTWNNYLSETASEVELFIEQLEEELEHQQIMKDVMGHGQE